MVLDGGRDEHGGNAEREPDADALQQCDTAAAAGEAADGRHEQAVVDRDPEREGEHLEDDEGALRDLKPRRGGDPAVGLRRLEHDVVAELAEHDEVDDPRRPHRDDPRQALHLLHLLQRAQPPWVPLLLLPLRRCDCHHGRRLVEAGELIRVC